jgi:probable 2-oxoglutarate dehydrogenase E1 component DHKTD1
MAIQAASSSLEDLAPGTKFQPVLADPTTSDSSIERVVLLSGKLYYELTKARAARGLDNRVALVRVEELCPFPFAAIREVLARYTNAAEVRWVQEEPRNQGAYPHVAPRVAHVLQELGRRPLVYAGRKEAAVPAPGVGRTYAEEQKQVLAAAFQGL